MKKYGRPRRRHRANKQQKRLRAFINRLRRIAIHIAVVEAKNKAFQESLKIGGIISKQNTEPVLPRHCTTPDVSLFPSLSGHKIGEHILGKSDAIILNH